MAIFDNSADATRAADLLFYQLAADANMIAPYCQRGVASPGPNGLISIVFGSAGYFQVETTEGLEQKFRPSAKVAASVFLTKETAESLLEQLNKMLKKHDG